LQVSWHLQVVLSRRISSGQASLANRSGPRPVELANDEFKVAADKMVQIVGDQLKLLMEK